MATIEYVEDALEEVLSLFLWDHGELSWQDHTILTSLGNAVNRNGSLTRKQSNLLLRLLTKYQHVLHHKIDLTEVIANPKWKHDFRKLDLSKSIKVEQDAEGTRWIVMKFPYDLLAEFEETIVATANRENTLHSRLQWDTENRVRKLDLYDFNVVVIDEFVRKHNFTIEDSFLDALNQVEEIWQQMDNISPCSAIQDDEVVLVNAAKDADNYFQANRTGQVDQDLFLAKSMGFVASLPGVATSIVEKIAKSTTSHFWLKSNQEFLQLYRSIGGPAAFILDRNTENLIDWLDKFISDAKELGIDTQDFKVCHREAKDSSIPLNDWIKDNGLGGSVKDGKLFIFKQKPSKWLFSNGTDVKIVGTNSYTPVNETSTMWWMQSHPCVCYVSNITPTKSRNRQIAHL